MLIRMPNDAFSSPTRNGSWFRSWLKARRFSDRYIAERLGVTAVTIGNWKRNGELKPAIVLALAQIDAEDLGERIRTAGS